MRNNQSQLQIQYNSRVKELEIAIYSYNIFFSEKRVKEPGGVQYNGLG